MKIDEKIARQRLHAVLPLLTEDERHTAMRMIDGELPMAAREAAVEQLAASSENGLELLRAFYDMCVCFALDATTPTSATEVN